MPQIEVLSLGSGISERALGALKPLDKLRSISRQAGIGDEGIKQVCDFKSLRGIGPLTNVTDAGLRDLGKITT